MIACPPIDWTGLGHFVIGLGVASTSILGVLIRRDIKNGNGK